MFNTLITRLQRNRRLAVAALISFTVLFAGGSYFTQAAIDARHGVQALLGVLAVLVGLLGQLISLAAVFKQH
jgi:hypothetical protein